MQNPRAAWTLSLLLLGLLASPATAQERPRTLEHGDAVRVSAPAVRTQPIEGTLVGYQDDLVSVLQPTSRQVYAVPVADIRKFSRNEGRDRGRSVRRSARFAGFLGAALGFTVGPLIATTQHPDHYARTIVASGVGGLALGTSLGAGIGAIFVRDQWQAYRIPSLGGHGAAISGPRGGPHAGER